MKIRKNGKVIKLTESDLRRIVKKTMINEQNTNTLENQIIDLSVKYCHDELNDTEKKELVDNFHELEQSKVRLNKNISSALDFLDSLDKLNSEVKEKVKDTDCFDEEENILFLIIQYLAGEDTKGKLGSAHDLVLKTIGSYYDYDDDGNIIDKDKVNQEVSKEPNTDNINISYLKR